MHFRSHFWQKLAWVAGAGAPHRIWKKRIVDNPKREQRRRKRGCDKIDDCLSWSKNTEWQAQDQTLMWTFETFELFSLQHGNNWNFPACQSSNFLLHAYMYRQGRENSLSTPIRKFLARNVSSWKSFNTFIKVVSKKRFLNFWAPFSFCSASRFKLRASQGCFN